VSLIPLQFFGKISLVSDFLWLQSLRHLIRCCNQERKLNLQNMNMPTIFSFASKYEFKFPASAASSGDGRKSFLPLCKVQAAADDGHPEQLSALQPRLCNGLNRWKLDIDGIVIFGAVRRKCVIVIAKCTSTILQNRTHPLPCSGFSPLSRDP
jgi:hypothetical protein